ncbi:MAG TPA: hypothetical protein VHV51_24525 [Polyangiaceae bacterium]|jgi:hypothetical protein|nr:hypothetical protein [Polyangiaceae bacterium]
MYWLRRRLAFLAFFVAPLLVLPALLVQKALFVCHMSGRVIDTCCCARAERAPESRPSTLAAPECCERVGQVAKMPAPRLPQASTEIAPAALLTVLEFGAPPRIARRASSRSGVMARAPPNEGPSIFLKNRVWLI